MLLLKIPPHLKCVATLPCEMSSVLKATTENKTISVTIHFKKLTTGNNVYVVWVIVWSSCYILQLYVKCSMCPLAAGRRTDIPAAWWTSRSSSLILCGLQELGLESSRSYCFRCPSTDGLSASTIHDNQPTEAGDRHWVDAPLVIGVAGLNASSSSKANILNIWCKNCRMWQLL